MKFHSLLTIGVFCSVSYFTYAQVTPSQTVPAQPKVTNPNLKVDTKLRVNPAAQTLTNGSRKTWKLTAMSTNNYKRAVDAGSCYADNELILSSDQSANYSEGAKVCSMSMNLVSGLKWDLSADAKKLMLSGLPAMKTDNSNALVGFLLGSEADILELTNTTLRIRFKASDGYINGKLNVVTNELTYTAQ